MNKSIIEDICFNNESLFEQVELSEEYKKRSKIAYKLYSQLNDALNDEQKKLFNEFADSEMAVSAEGESLFFKAGLKAGLLLVMECIV